MWRGKNGEGARAGEGQREKRNESRGEEEDRLNRDFALIEQKTCLKEEI